MTRFEIVLFLVLVRTTSFQTHAHYACGTIGNSNENRVIERRDQMFYLNTANPAPCTGNITSWRVCYYQPVDRRHLRTYWATYAVYRKMDSGAAEQYERVSDVYRAVRATRALLDVITRRNRNSARFAPVDGEVLDGYVCYNDSIDVGGSPLTVQTGDVVGACVFDPLDSGLVVQYQLDIVSEVNGESLLAMASNAAGCTVGTLPSTISANQLSIIHRRRLHLYANIEPNLVLCKAALSAVNTSLQLSNAELEALSITQTISSSTLSISPAMSSSVLHQILCYATYRRTTSTTTTSQMNKFAQSTPTSGVSPLDQDVIGSDRLAGIIAGIVVGALLLVVSLVVIISVTLSLYLKKLKKERDKNSFNLTHNPAYMEEDIDDSTQFNSFNVTANVNATGNVHPVHYFQALEQEEWSRHFQNGHREILPIPIRSIDFNMNQNFVYTPTELPAPPALGVLPAAIGEPQNLDSEEDNVYECIT